MKRTVIAALAPKRSRLQHARLMKQRSHVRPHERSIFVGHLSDAGLSAWVEHLEIRSRVESRNRRERTIERIAYAMIAMVLGISVFAEVTKDSSLVVRVLWVGEITLVYVCVWACGRSLLGVLSRLDFSKLEDRDETDGRTERRP